MTLDYTHDWELSDHGEERLQQRGVKEAELPLLLHCSTPVDEHVLQLMDADVEREVAQRKREIEALERLRGCQVVLNGEAVVTVYHPSKRRTKRNLRRQRSGPHRLSRHKAFARRSVQPASEPV